MRISRLWWPLVLSSAGCVGVSVGTDDDEFFRVRGLGTAYAALPGIDDYDGKILRVGLLARAPAGAQLAGIELWPLLSVGVGLVGARVRVLPVEVGAGALFYEPKPIRRKLPPRGAVLDNEVHDAPRAPEADDVPIKPLPAGKGSGDRNPPDTGVARRP
jgi:hypothetical protein